MALALARACLADRQQPAEAAIGRAVGWIDQQRRSTLQIEAAADDEANARRLRGFIGAHDAGQRIPVDDAEGLDAKQGSVRE
jgi:hypothetical protein